MSASMRAKVRCTGVEKIGDPASAERLSFDAVAASKYPEDGSDENNTFAKFSPSAHFTIHVANPALLGRFEVNECYYVDFTPAQA